MTGSDPARHDGQRSGGQSRAGAGEDRGHDPRDGGGLRRGAVGGEAPAAAPSPSGRSHLQRQVAEGFGADAGRYDRARPTYRADLIGRIIAASPGRDSLTPAAARASRPGSSRRPAAGCSALTPTRGEWLDLMPTTGGFGRMPASVQREILAGLGAAGGSFTMGCTTLAVTAARLAP